MIFVTFSRPFCTPREQTSRPAATVIAIKIPISTGLPSMPVNTLSEVSAVTAVNAPETNLKK